MKKQLILMLLLPIMTFAQVEQKTEGTNLNTIELQLNRSKIFKKGNQEYKISKYKQIFTDKEAIRYVQKARSNKIIGNILGYAGGFGIGFGMGMVIFTKKEGSFYKEDRKTGWIIAGTGLGITLISIPFWTGYTKNLKNAVEIENEKSTDSSSSVRFNIGGEGIGLVYNF